MSNKDNLSEYDIAIIGAGSSALFCAAYLYYLNDLSASSRNIRILITDGNNTVGKKLALTGNGRCNLTNTDIKLTEYNTDDYDKLSRVMDNFSAEDTISFFNRIMGIDTVVKDNLVYPATLKSSTVISGLEMYIREHGCTILLNNSVKQIHYSSDTIVLNGDVEIQTKYLVLACGGASYPKTGSDGKSYGLIRDLISKDDLIPLVPSLVQVVTKNTFPSKLSGMRIKASVSVNADGISRKEYGELLFTDYGVSGILVMQLSGVLNRICAKTGKYPIIEVDLFPNYSSQDLLNRINEIKNSFVGRRTVPFALQGLILPEIVSEILFESDIKSLVNKRLSELSDLDINRLSSLLKQVRLRVSKTLGFDNAQVTSGGLKLNSLTDTLMIKGHNNIYAIGEFLNVDGPCGGYNLQWAWSSAVMAAEGIYGNL